MPSTNLTQLEKTELAQRLDWIETVYTAMGTFWAAWAITALVGIYTRSNVNIPLFGEVTLTEVVVYTLYAFTLGIPFLLLVVFRHRRIQKSLTSTRLLPKPRFPKLSESGMPASFRTLSFVVLVVLPIVAQEIALIALWRDVCIAWKPQKWWRAEDYNYNDVLAKPRLFTFPNRPDGRDYANWRFMRLENGHVVDLKERAPRPEDDDGRPPTAKGKIPVQITAFPGYAPWAFCIMAQGSAILAGWLLLTRDGSLPRKLVARAGKKKGQGRGGKDKRGPGRLLNWGRV